MGDKWNYESIKALAAASGTTVREMIALAPNNDPFYNGAPADVAKAAWFADLWERFGYRTGIHIRRVHYQIVSQDPPVRQANGLPYENTEACWNYLSGAAKAARYLGFVDSGAFVDKRNPAPHIYTAEASTPTISVNDVSWLDVEFPAFPDLPHYSLHGYSARQPYHCEVWCEKSTMDDVLKPLCARYNANLVTGVGEMSVTACLQLATRFNGRPVRVFYVSDFDPAGQSMPVAVARKIEHFQRNEGYDADVRLTPLVLTPEQVREYRLPRTPIKETERRAASFEDRYGEGAVELDALEALHPGELRRIVSGAFEQYIDDDLDQRVRAAKLALFADLEATQQAISDDYALELALLRAEHASLQAEFGKRFEDYAGRLASLWGRIAQDMEAATPGLYEYPIPSGALVEETDAALYDSTRDYLRQLHAYKTYQGRNDNQKAYTEGVHRD